MPTPTAVVIKLTDEERDRLEAWSRRPKTAQALALRSRIVLAAADGLSNGEIAHASGCRVRRSRSGATGSPSSGLRDCWTSRGRDGRAR